MVGRLDVRPRWAAVGAVVAVLLGGGGLLTASAAGSPSASSFVPITPCRLFDTRPGTDNVGTRSTPIGANETYTVPVWGSNGNCVIPTGATGVSISVVSINPTAASFLTVFPADVGRPVTSNLNWVAGQAPTPNAVTAPLSAEGRMALYNLAGTVDVLVDIVGYYELSTGGLSTSGPPGPPGPKGDTGGQGPPGPSGLSVGRFTPTQIVSGAILTCVTTIDDATTTSCHGMKLNGLDVRYIDTDWIAICSAVTGAGYAGAGGAGPLSDPSFTWNGSTWVLASNVGTPLQDLGCNL